MSDAPFRFQVISTDGAARRGLMTTPHGTVETPAFMPVGTQGAVKGLSHADLDSIGVQILLSNTYHLYLRPGDHLVARRGGHMISFLTIVTVIYAVVLVLVLAVSLSTILYYLWSIGTTLGKISGGLQVVRDQTAPLPGHLEAINGALDQVASGLAGALDDLSPGRVPAAAGGACPALTQIKYPFITCEANEYGGTTLRLPDQP